MATVLVVDDEPHIRRLVSFSLAKHGFDVLEAADGMQGIEMAEDNHPDLILMDVMMPLMTGFEAVERLRDSDATKDIPIVMLSAKSQVYEQEEGLRRGALRYMCKPFNPGELVATVSEVLEGA